MQQLWAATGSHREVTGRGPQKVGVRQTIEDEEGGTGGRDASGLHSEDTDTCPCSPGPTRAPARGLILAPTLSDSGLRSVSPLRQKGGLRGAMSGR